MHLAYLVRTNESLFNEGGRYCKRVWDAVTSDEVCKEGELYNGCGQAISTVSPEVEAWRSDRQFSLLSTYYKVPFNT